MKPPALKWSGPLLAAAGLLLLHCGTAPVRGPVQVPVVVTEPAPEPTPDPIPVATPDPTPAETRPRASLAVPSEAQLLVYEKELLAARRGPRAGTPSFGSDPYKLKYLENQQGFLVLLRGADELQLCDAELRPLVAAATPRSPVAWDLVDERFLFVAGSGGGPVRCFRVDAGQLAMVADLDLKDTASVRDLVYVPEVHGLFLLDAFDNRLVYLQLNPDWAATTPRTLATVSWPLGAGPLAMRSVAGHLLINCLLDHYLLVLPLRGGRPDFGAASRIPNDGSFWSMDALVVGEELLIAAGGIENHPLARTEGGFGYVDSFLYLFRLEPSGKNGAFQWDERTRASHFAEFNLSAIKLVTPKAIRWQTRGSEPPRLWVSGYGQDRLASFRLERDDFALLPDRRLRALPGVTDLALVGDDMVLASPLLDRVEKVNLARGEAVAGYEPVPQTRDRRDSMVRLGEILFFTTLMSPSNSSEGGLSRFTCEACHFEGTVDGRIHFTGRDQVYATPKTLRGLADKVPFFSSGGDTSLARMVLAEFRVANQGRKDRFSIDRQDWPWLDDLADLPRQLDPATLRRALLAFFVAFDHPPNPWALHQESLTSAATAGLPVFRDRCAACHQAVWDTRKREAVPFEQWADLLLEEGRGPVWGAPFYFKTGVRPYFDTAGTQVPSLRRVWQKYPYFTDGSAADLREVLESFRFGPHGALHRVDPDEHRDIGPQQSLSPAEVDALEALLRYF